LKYQSTSCGSENRHHESDSDSDSDFNDLKSTNGEDTRIDSSESRKKRLHLNEQAKQICLNVYNNLLKERA
jgi:hypothetical protein